MIIQSVLSTLLRLFLPYHPSRSADVGIKAPRIKRPCAPPKPRRNAPSTTNSSISSVDSVVSSSSEESSTLPLPPPSTSLIHAHAEVRPRTFKSLSRGMLHSRRTSQDDTLIMIERPDFRNTTQPRRRSESTPPSPAPWSSPEAASSTTAPARHSSVDRSPESHNEVHAGFRLLPVKCTKSKLMLSAETTEPLSSPDVLPAHKSTGLSFLSRRKVHKTSSVPNGLLTSSPAPPVPSLPTALLARRKSQLFGPLDLLQRRRSQHLAEEAAHAPAAPVSTLESRCSQLFRHSLENRRSMSQSIDDDIPQDGIHLVQKRPSQVLRTQPYEAPYFFPAPGSEAAENYLPPRRKPSRSKTLPVE
ncbi:hypothetical protein B0H10DRAFT_2056253 [Mycena sp. CBHHK59/15]|nr:hypothetical protein B0H10DRAFT_2056253 [Mycena sp. CBHHK59/15]